MKAIELLRSEHRTIEKALDAMETWVERRPEIRNRLEQDMLARFVSFLREFVDDCHHAKEENILFATMIEQGFPREQGPIAVMLHEHELGRSLVGTLSSFAQQQTSWNEDDWRHVERTVRAFARLLREHIQKEDGVLYPLAEQRLSTPAKEKLSMLFERFEADRTGCGHTERLRELTARLLESSVGEGPWLPG